MALSGVEKRSHKMRVHSMRRDRERKRQNDDDDKVSVTHSTGRGCVTCSLATPERGRGGEPPVCRSHNLKTRDQVRRCRKRKEMRRRKEKMISSRTHFSATEIEEQNLEIRGLVRRLELPWHPSDILLSSVVSVTTTQNGREKGEHE